ncbi:MULTISPECIES: hypothetical protein [Vibrionaceae]|uniref:PD(D/E)XK endonuclease domain-containing protein n=1 Tax=Photobacterium alginatilyticum TaxID=1775171 RepID=A0ABW9YRP7_9GAMM|nr:MULTISPECIES: hypothetical protein [Vibrionaceae]NBI56237.1 hypothetical protein [Photobacterium alginatilyticum]NOH31461.1 hypothetical protein [Vibrio mediterranei]
MDKIYSAIDDYANSYLKLWRIVQEENAHFPTCSISSGSIAEFYAKKYLEEKYPNSHISFGASNEKAWDIKVITESEEVVLFQVKSTSDYSKSRKLSPLTKGFDQLIVITLACDFFPCQAFLFTDPKVLFKNGSMPSLTVPNPDNKKQPGSKVFKSAINIHDEFFGNLADAL